MYRVAGKVVESKKERVLLKQKDVIKEILSEHQQVLEQLKETEQFPNIIVLVQRVLNYDNLALFNKFYNCNDKGQGPG